jgi:excisionase family DNA binding protein
MKTKKKNSGQHRQGMKKGRHLTPALSPIEAERERRAEQTTAPAAACVTRFELASLLQVSLRTVDRMIAADEIPVRRVRGKAVRFLRSDVEDYLREKRKAESEIRKREI